MVPTLKTPRLTLRALRIEDAPRVRLLAGAREVAMNTLTIPHPYPDGAAEQFIRLREISSEDGELAFAIDDVDLVGVIGLNVRRADDAAELGYWIGVPYWGRGFATEAGRAIVRFGFETLRLNRIHAGFFTRNPASGAVLRKLGMKHEGTLRRHHKKFGEHVDVELMAVLREEWRP